MNKHKISTKKSFIHMYKFSWDVYANDKLSIWK